MCAIYMLPRKYQIKVSILICLSVMVLVGSGFETKCPEPSQWKFRKKICDTPENYSCLYNIQTGQYEESCSDKIDFVKAGKQYIRTGGRGRDSADCNDLRYQPTKFWSDETSDCEMLKSTCSEEGQVAVSDGSSIEDRACRCDTLNGFGSITTNTSSCIPSVEDCNCYRTTYDKSEIHARGFDYGKFPKTSRKYYPVRETGIKLPESRSSTGTSRTVFTLGKESIWKKLNRNGYTIVDVVLQDMVLCLCFSTVFGVLIFVWRKKFGSFLNSFEGKYRFFEDLIQDNWVHLKENGNSPTWKKKFIEANFMTENDPELQVLLKRKQLVELLLNKCRHSVKTKEDIRMVISTIFQYQISDTRTSSRTEYALSNVTSEGITRWTEILSNNRKMIETKLTREDVITIKDDLVQHYIISLKENENLMQPCGQSSLAAQLIELLINKLRTGSYQCFLQSLETIKNSEDDRNRLTDLINVLTRDSTDDDLFSGATPNRMMILEHVKSTFYKNNIEGKDSFVLTLTVENEEGQEETEVYKHLIKRSDDVNRILSSHLGGSVAKTSNGSLVIDLQMMERNMQDHLKCCLRNGGVTTLVHKLFSEISLENIIPHGKLHLKVKVEVNEDSSLLEPLESIRSSDITSFVIDNRFFLIEEMDTAAMKLAFENCGILIPTDDQCISRKQKANNIFNFVVKHGHQRFFINVITMNKGNTLDYLRRRLEDYRKVYKAELEILRKNILLQFSQIVSTITIYDIKDVLLHRNTIEPDILCDIRIKYYTNNEAGMATLLLIILKSGDAVRAFVDALFIMNSFLAEQMLRCQIKSSVIETGPMVEIRETSPEKRLLSEGYFIIDIIQEGFLQQSTRNDSNSLSIVRKLYLTKKNQSLKNKILEFLETLLKWLQEALTVIATLQDLAEELDVHFTRISKAKIGGSAAGIVGGVLGIVGLALTPFTFGASLGLTIAGGAVAGIGGVTVGGSLIADNVLSKKTKTKAQAQLTIYSNYIVTIKKTCLDLSLQLGNTKKLEDQFPDWVRFWAYFTHGQDSNVSENQWTETQQLLENLDTFTAAARFVIGEGMGTGVRIAGAAVRVTGTSLHLISGVIGALMIPLDIFTIVDSAIDLHTKNKHKTAKLIIQLSETIRKELPTEKDIKNMIKHTINSI